MKGARLVDTDREDSCNVSRISSTEWVISQKSSQHGQRARTSETGSSWRRQKKQIFQHGKQ